MKFTTTILEARPGVTGIEVPPEIIDKLGKGKKPAVSITLNGFTYECTVGSMGGRFMVPLSKERRAEAQVEAGESHEIHISLAAADRTVEVPDDLAKALDKGAREFFDSLPYSHRKEHVRAINEAKKPETRQRRIEKVVEQMKARTK